MIFVLDASVAVAWLFADEDSVVSQRALAAIEADATVYVPPLWRYEVANALLVAERRSRVAAEVVQQQLSLLEVLPLRVDALSLGNCFGATIALAREHGLSVYDAAYLEMARRRGCLLATLDGALIRAAQKVGVAVLA